METMAVVMANGVIENLRLIRKRLEGTAVHFVVAADGGTRHAADLGLQLDLIVGDLDSISRQDETRAAAVEIERHPEHKDETDLELALQAALARDPKRVAVIGATGGRLDMTIGNTILLAHPAFRGRRIEIWHNHQTAWLIRPPGDEIHGEAGDRLSLIALGGDASGITLKNMVYPLQDEKLEFGMMRGISNQLDSPPALVSLKSGLLLAVHTAGSGETQGDGR